VPIAAVLLLAGVYLLTPLSRLELPAPHGGYLDAHAWILGVGAGGSGVFVSRELARSSTFNAYLDSFGVTRADLERHGDGLIARRMNTLLAGSRHVRSAVVLAVDGVVRDDRIDHAATWLHVPNDYVAGLADEHPQLEFGASIHPRRSDWQRRLNRARRRGARLVYWLPSLMDSVIRQVVDASGKIEAEGGNPVLLVSSSIRLFLSRLLRGRMNNFYILAYEEIPPSKSIRVVATIGSGQAGRT